MSRIFSENIRRISAKIETIMNINTHRKYSIRYENITRSSSELFDMIKDPRTGVLNADTFFKLMKRAGIHFSDPRLAGVVDVFKEIQPLERHQETHNFSLINIDLNMFETIMSINHMLITKALTNQFIVPEFEGFRLEIEKMYLACKDNTAGKPADYIPVLATVDPNLWAVSICTVDGQRCSFGDKRTRFSLQSCSKPLNYAFALEKLGAGVVHEYVGQEPSGRKFNKLVLDYNNKPHNPMVNSGAIMICAITKTLAHKNMNRAENFDASLNFFTRLAGGERITFDNSVYLSEKEAGNRNYALGYYMREYKCYPPETDFLHCMDFYFQCCTMGINTATGSVIAATLASGGICPITNEKVINPENVRNVLSLMYSCGMYDYSGQFAFQIGLPAKSGVGGGLLIVVPDLMGICTYSPPLDSYSCPVRGVQFCQELVKNFNFHKYDSSRLIDTKRSDPTKTRSEVNAIHIVSVISAAANGDLHTLERFHIHRHHICGMDLGIADYDGRTALHLAAAEGQLACVRYLLEFVGRDVKDRWGRTPLQEAVDAGKAEVAALLKSYVPKPKAQ